MAERSLDHHGYDNDGELILTGSANAYVAATARSITGYFQGLRICCKANHTNSGAATLNVNGIGAVDIRKSASTALVAGDIVSGKYYDFIYDTATPSFQAMAVSVPAAGTISTAMLADDSVTYAKMQNVSATSRVIGRKTAGAGDLEELTLSEVLDFIGSAAQGDILYRGAASWARLGAGTSGQFLQTQGAGANPQWASVSSAVTLLASGTVSAAATLDIVMTGYTAYRMIEFVLTKWIPATDDVELWMQFSTDGGLSYDASGYNWMWSGTRDGVATSPISQGSGSASQIVVAGRGPTASQGISNVAGDGGADVRITIYAQTTTASGTGASFQSRWMDATATPQSFQATGGGQLETVQDTDAVRFLMESGNITSGNYAVYGYL